jgi:putative endonuclease
LNRASQGREGENRAAAFLEKSGFRIVERNFRSRNGEIDIIAMDGETLVFVEVKAWSKYGIEDLQWGINAKKQRRIIETAKYFLLLNRKYNDKAIRFDVVFVQADKISHLASAFMECV